MNNLDVSIRELIIEVLKLPADIEVEHLNSDTISEWDSMGHIQIIIKLEEMFLCEIPRNKVPLMASDKKIIEELTKLLTLR